MEIQSHLISDINKFENWLSTNDQQWLSQFKSNKKLIPIPDIPPNWNHFQEFELQYLEQQYLITVEQLIGNGPEAFLIRGDNSMSYINPEDVHVQNAEFQSGAIVAVRAPKNSKEDFWLATITEVSKERDKIQYSLHYWKQKNDNNSQWTKMKGNGAYGSAAHKAIIFGPVSMNDNGSMKALSLRQLNVLLKK